MSMPEPGPPLPGAQPRSTRGPLALGVLAGLIVLAIVVASLAGWKPLSGDRAPRIVPNPTITPTPSTAGAMPTTATALARVYDQRLRWHGCGSNRCATLRVPLDYAKPAGAVVKIAVLKVPAAD